MVVVVPGLAERGHRQPEHVAGLVVGGEPAATEEVADRVDRERHVVQQEDPHQAAPEQADQAAAEAAGGGVADRERDRQPQSHPAREQAADPAHQRVRHQVARVTLGLGPAGGREQPAHVGVPQAGQRPAQAPAGAHVRAVRVALLVGERVVLAVVGDPVDHRPLHRHRAQHGEHGPDPADGLERAVGEQAVEAHRHAQPGGHVHRGHHRQVQRTDEPLPQEHQRRHEGAHRNEHAHEIPDLLRPAHRNGERSAATPSRAGAPPARWPPGRPPCRPPPARGPRRP